MQKLILFLFTLGLFIACKFKQPAEALKLNAGQKWAINAEMKPHIEQGEIILKDYLAQNNTDHKKLSDVLKIQNDQLIKSCTMKGPSHDELHKWLHPHLDLVKQLTQADDAQKAQSLVAQLEKSFQTFHNYFE